MSAATTPERERWNRDYLFDILRTLGIRYMFGVPGTNEIPCARMFSFYPLARARSRCFGALRTVRAPPEEQMLRRVAHCADCR